MPKPQSVPADPGRNVSPFTLKDMNCRFARGFQARRSVAAGRETIRSSGSLM
jgi:hypothetical protein